MTQHTHTPPAIQKKIRGPYVSLEAFQLLDIMAKNRTCNPLDLVAYAIKEVVSDVEAVHLSSNLDQIEVPSHIEWQPSSIFPVPPEPLTGGPKKGSAKAVRKGKRLGNMASPVILTIDYLSEVRKWGKGQLIQFALESIATADELAQWEATKAPTTPAPSPAEPVL